jgi:GR25 family glycosyltransferase involved in LPS biosynthesis
MSYKIFFLCNKLKEPERYESLLKQIAENNITNYEIVSYYWSDDITPEFKNEWVKTDTAMITHGRAMAKHPLTNGEISLFMNYITCLKNIKDSNKDGLFFIFESDVFFKKEFSNYISELIRIVENRDDWDTVNIGEGACKQLARGRVEGIFDIYRERINRCAEGILWSYRGICKFLDTFSLTNDIDGPIDTKMDYYSTDKGALNIFWSHPPLVFQGSVKKLFKSHMHDRTF